MERDGIRKVSTHFADYCIAQHLVCCTIGTALSYPLICTNPPIVQNHGGLLFVTFARIE